MSDFTLAKAASCLALQRAIQRRKVAAASNSVTKQDASDDEGFELAHPADQQADGRLGHWIDRVRRHQRRFPATPEQAAEETGQGYYYAPLVRRLLAHPEFAKSLRGKQAGARQAEGWQDQLAGFYRNLRAGANPSGGPLENNLWESGRNALLGASAGGLVGLGRNLFSQERRPNLLQDMLTGGLLGGDRKSVV